MDERRWEQLAAAAGLVFVALLLGAFLVLPDCDTKNPGFAACLLDHSGAVGIGSFLAGLGVVFFLLFLASMVMIL